MIKIEKTSNKKLDEEQRQKKKRKKDHAPPPHLISPNFPLNSKFTFLLF